MNQPHWRYRMRLFSDIPLLQASQPLRHRVGLQQLPRPRNDGKSLCTADSQEFYCRIEYWVLERKGEKVKR